MNTTARVSWYTLARKRKVSFPKKHLLKHGLNPHAASDTSIYSQKSIMQEKNMNSIVHLQLCGRGASSNGLYGETRSPRLASKQCSPCIASIMAEIRHQFYKMKCRVVPSRDLAPSTEVGNTERWGNLHAPQWCQGEARNDIKNPANLP